VIRPGDVQRMSAGTGVSHSEQNPSPTEPVHFLQIWILPEREGLAPSYQQKHFPKDGRRGVLRLVASHDGREDSIRIHQDVALYATLLGPGEAVEHLLRPGRHAWVQMARGSSALNGIALEEGDGASVSDEGSLRLVGPRDAEALLFDLA
jgi:redox-sensitive bicupin YhaK (pirin superfamily)